MAESKAKLSELARLDKERLMLEEIRNSYESYIYKIKNALIDDEEAIGAISTQEQRDEILKLAEDAEEWMYDDGYDASLETYTEKYSELTAPAEKIFFRVAEVPARAQAIEELRTKLGKVIALMMKWETTMPQVTEEERKDVLEKVEGVKKWIEEKESAQAAADPAADPVFTSEEVPLQTKEIQILVSKLSRRPKPVPKKEKKNETDTKSEKKNETDSDEKEEVKENADEEKSDDKEKSEDEETSEKKEDEASDAEKSEESSNTETEDEL